MRLERIPITGGFILADAALEPRPDWFDPSWWRERGAGEPLGRGRGVAVSAGPGGEWVLRHYHRGGLPGRIVADCYAWTGETRTRPVREARTLIRLAEAGAPVPRPVAARVLRRGALYRGDIMTERVPEARTLATAAPRLAPEAWRSVGRALRRFHDAGGWHADLNAGNILLSPAGVYVIDLDRGRTVPPGSRSQRANLRRLARSLRKLGVLPAAADGWRALCSGYAAP